MRLAVALLACSALAPQDGAPAAHWDFDGDPGPGTKTHGAVHFVASPIGASGTALELNGVDAFLEITPAATLGAGADDFTISVWVCPLKMPPGWFLWRKNAWQLGIGSNGTLSFAGRDLKLQVKAPNRISANRWFHVAVTIKKNEKENAGTLWVNGENVARGNIGPGDLDPAKEPLFCGWWSSEPVGGGSMASQSYFCGLLDDVRLYAKSLDGAEISRIAEEGMPWVLKRARTPFGGTFALEKDDVVAFVGGEDVLAAQECGALEAHLSAWARGRRVLFRSLAWEGDTVYEQPRLLNFGTWGDQLSRAGASVIVAQFGQMEALEGRGGLARFTAAYDKLLGTLAETTPRIVVVSPIPYERSAAPLPDGSARNGDLGLYVESMKRIALDRKLLFVDLFNAKLAVPLTRDGIHLSAEGHEIVAKEIARQLGVPPSENQATFRDAIRKKNKIWREYWSPSNWAFLNGDRIEQPSSRDHADRRIRWFPVEVQKNLALVRRVEAAIEKYLEAKR